MIIFDLHDSHFIINFLTAILISKARDRIYVLFTTYFILLGLPISCYFTRIPTTLMTKDPKTTFLILYFLYVKFISNCLSLLYHFLSIIKGPLIFTSSFSNPLFPTPFYTIAHHWPKHAPLNLYNN